MQNENDILITEEDAARLICPSSKQHAVSLMHYHRTCGNIPVHFVEAIVVDSMGNIVLPKVKKVRMYLKSDVLEYIQKKPSNQQRGSQRKIVIFNEKMRIECNSIKEAAMRLGVTYSNIYYAIRSGVKTNGFFAEYKEN